MIKRLCLIVEPNSEIYEVVPGLCGSDAKHVLLPFGAAIEFEIDIRTEAIVQSQGRTSSDFRAGRTERSGRGDNRDSS